MLPYAIEYILTLHDGARRLCYQGVSQLYIPILPPSTQLTLEAFPMNDDYCDILYHTTLSPAMVPNTLYGVGNQYGNNQYSGTLASWFVHNDIPSFVPVMASQPAYAQVKNISLMNQVYEGMVFFVSIRTVDDYMIVVDALDRMGTSSKVEALANDCKLLLSAISGVRPSAVGGK